MTDTFVKSSYSGGNGGDCVEWAHTPAGVAVRDSKDPAGPRLRFTAAGWDALVAAVAAGRPHPAVIPAGRGVHLTGDGATLAFTPAEWRAFAAAARDGQCHPLPAAS